MFDWLSIITLITSFITGGGISALFFIKQERKGKDLDNEGKKVENTKSLVEEYKSLLEHYKTEFEKAHAKVEELTDRVNECQRQLAVVQTELANAQLLYTTANALRCDKINCKLRKPPLDKEYLSQVAGFQAREYSDDDAPVTDTPDDN